MYLQSFSLLPSWGIICACIQSKYHRSCCTYRSMSHAYCVAPLSCQGQSKETSEAQILKSFARIQSIFLQTAVSTDKSSHRQHPQAHYATPQRQQDSPLKMPEYLARTSALTDCRQSSRVHEHVVIISCTNTQHHYHSQIQKRFSGSNNSPTAWPPSKNT